MGYTKQQRQRQRELWEAVAAPPGELDDHGNLLSDQKEPQTSKEHAQALREVCEALAAGHYDHERHQKVLEDAANHLDAQGDDDAQPMESRRRLRQVNLAGDVHRGLGGRRPQQLTEARLAAARKVFDRFEESGGGAGEARRHADAWKRFEAP